MLTPVTPTVPHHGGPIPYGVPRRDPHVGGFAHPGGRADCGFCRAGHWHNCVRLGCTMKEVTH